MGARSTNFIVPCAWEIDHCLLEEVKTRGNDVGIHGYDHNNLTAFSKLHARRQRIRAGAQFNDRYGIIGYRSPSLLRTPDLLRDLTKFYRFDSSIPTSGGLFPVPNNGCASARPFPIEGLHEIPISLPRDGSLIFLGYSPNQILTTWIHCAEQISRSGGVIVLLTHCERRFSGNLGMLNTYRKFLDFIAASNRFEWSHPRKILSALQ